VIEARRCQQWGENMNVSRRLFALGGALVATAAAVRSVFAADAGPMSTKRYRVVIQVSNPEPRTWAQALNYTENLQELYGKDNVELELVALGLGLGVLKLDSPMAERVADSSKRGVNVLACEVTMRRQKLTRDDMLSGIGYVPAGLGQIIERQRQGWNYISG
jgi:intracellular sulfur oxidation DsrE/DsrF family protein